MVRTSLHMLSGLIRPLRYEAHVLDLEKPKYGRY